MRTLTAAAVRFLAARMAGARLPRPHSTAAGGRLYWDRALRAWVPEAPSRRPFYVE